VGFLSHKSLKSISIFSNDATTVALFAKYGKG
jgi:hypothetical protein